MKNKIITTFQKISSLVRNFGFTMLLLILWTTVWIIEKKLFPAYIAFITPDMFKCMKKLDILFCFMMLAFFSSLLIETCIEGNRKLKLISSSLAGMVSGTLTFLMHYDNISFSLFKRIDGIITGYVIVLTALIIYYSFRKSDLSFSKYLERIFYSFIPIIPIYIALLIGGIFVLIIAKILFNRWLMSSEMLMTALFMLYIVPSCIYILNHVEKDGNATVRLIIKYVINVCSILIMLIGYAYILKILILREVPSNEIFAKLTVLFGISTPIWIMNENYCDESLRSKVMSVIPYIFAPLIGMQVYSLTIRIGEFGFTCNRYIGIMVILFEISTIIIWKLKRNHCESLLFVLSALVVISVVFPGINMHSVSYRNQKYFLDKYLQKIEAGEELSELEYRRFIGAYQYQKNWMNEADFESKYGKVAEIIDE